jgi:hypothetical protein
MDDPSSIFIDLAVLSVGAIVALVGAKYGTHVVPFIGTVIGGYIGWIVGT